MLLSNFLDYVHPRDFPEWRKAELKKRGFGITKTGKILDISNVPYEKKAQILKNRNRVIDRLGSKPSPLTPLYPAQKQDLVLGSLKAEDIKDMKKNYTDKGKKAKRKRELKASKKPKTAKTPKTNKATPKVPINTQTTAIPVNTSPPKVSKTKGIPYKKLALAGGISLAGGLGYAAYMNRKERSDKGKKRGRYRK